MFCQLALGLITVYVKPTVIQYKYLKTRDVLNHFVNPWLRLQKVTKRPNLPRKRLEMKQSTEKVAKLNLTLAETPTINSRFIWGSGVFKMPLLKSNVLIAAEFQGMAGNGCYHDYGCSNRMDSIADTVGVQW